MNTNAEVDAWFDELDQPLKEAISGTSPTCDRCGVVDARLPHDYTPTHLEHKERS